VVQKLLGKRIAELRKAKGLSQEELAAKSKYSTEFISLV
jgi:transcriptional regulator with XRE-family HTH domain